MVPFSCAHLFVCLFVKPPHRYPPNENAYEWCAVWLARKRPLGTPAMDLESHVYIQT